MLLDRVFTVRHASLPVTPHSCNEDAFWFAGNSLSFSGEELNEARLSVRIHNLFQLALSIRDQSNPLGRAVTASADSSTPGEAIEPGDEVSLTVRRSFMSWTTPFQMNFMTGHSPSWKRQLYYALQWKKRNGA